MKITTLVDISLTSLQPLCRLSLRSSLRYGDLVAKKITQSRSKAAYKSKGNKVCIHHADAIALLKSLSDESIDLVMTDPAYSGMNQHLSLGKGRIVGKYSEQGREDDKWFQEFHDDVENYRVFLAEIKRVLKPNRHIFLMFDSYSLITLAPVVREFFEVKNLITWDKVNIGMGHYFRRQSEFILFASKGKRKISARNIPDIWKVKRIHNAKYPTQKPVEVFELMVKASRHEDDKDFVVLDPFVGSGSSAIASLRHSCTFIGADIAEHAIELTSNRVNAFLASGIDLIQPTIQIDSSQAHLLN